MKCSLALKRSCGAMTAKTKNKGHLQSLRLLAQLQTVAYILLLRLEGQDCRVYVRRTVASRHIGTYIAIRHRLGREDTSACGVGPPCLVVAEAHGRDHNVCFSCEHRLSVSSGKQEQLVSVSAASGGKRPTARLHECR